MNGGTVQQKLIELSRLWVLLLNLDVMQDISTVENDRFIHILPVMHCWKGFRRSNTYCKYKPFHRHHSAFMDVMC